MPCREHKEADHNKAAALRHSRVRAPGSSFFCAYEQTVRPTGRCVEEDSRRVPGYSIREPECSRLVLVHSRLAVHSWNELDKTGRRLQIAA